MAKSRSTSAERGGAPSVSLTAAVVLAAAGIAYTLTGDSPSSPESADSWFSHFDRDKSGTLDPLEMRGLVVDAEMTSRLFEEGDKNGDNEMTKEEFLAGMQTGPSKNDWFNAADRLTARESVFVFGKLLVQIVQTGIVAVFAFIFIALCFGGFNSCEPRESDLHNGICVGFLVSLMVACAGWGIWGPVGSSVMGVACGLLTLSMARTTVTYLQEQREYEQPKENLVDESHTVQDEVSTLAATRRHKWAAYLPPFAGKGATSDEDYNFACSFACVMVIVCAIAENTSSTAYGRFGGESSVVLDPRLGWWLMELPCSVLFIFLFFVRGGPQAESTVPRIIAYIFVMHYAYRGWYFPLSINVHKGTRNFSLVPALFSWVVTSTHAYLNARWFSTHAGCLSAITTTTSTTTDSSSATAATTTTTPKWLRSPQFWVGAVLYYTAMGMVVWHDNILRELRPCPNGAQYCIPHDGLFRYAVCPQYFLELAAWFGFWVLTGGGPNGAFIFFVSLVNLVPRAMATHAWYVKKFGAEFTDLNRGYMVPGLW